MAETTLMAGHHFHLRRLANDHAFGARVMLCQRVYQGQGAKAAGFLIIGKRQLDGAGQRLRQHSRHGSQNQC